MNRKRVICLVAGFAGLALFFYALHGMHEAEEAEGWIDEAESFFTGPAFNPLIEFFGGKAREEASKYDLPLLFMLILGIVFAVGGAAGYFYFRRKQ